MATGNDLIIDAAHLIRHLHKGEYQEALIKSIDLLNNSLYLSLFLHGGLEVAIASLAVQIMLGLYHSQEEFNKGNYLEASGHVLMIMVRGSQMSSQIELLKFRNKLVAVSNICKKQEQTHQISHVKEQLNDSGSVNTSALQKKSSSSAVHSDAPKELSDFYQKYKELKFDGVLADFNNYPPEFKACVAHDKAAVTLFLQYGWDINKCHSVQGGTHYWINKGTPLACVMYPLNFEHPLVSLKDQMAIADMSIFLMERGADVNHSSMDGFGGLNHMIRAWRRSGDIGLDVLIAAIKHGAYLHGSLRAALNLPKEVDAEYKNRVIELLIQSGARLENT